jgi:hypothetical protein
MTAGNFVSDAARSAAAGQRDRTRMIIFVTIPVECALRTSSPSRS